MIFKLYILHLFHPKDNLILMKRRSSSNWIPALIALLAVAAVRLFSVMAGSYLFSNNKEDINVFLEISRILIPTISFSVACYAITSILGGEVKFRELFTAFCFSLLPYIIITVPLTLVTWAFSLNESALYFAITFIKWLWIFLIGFQAVKQLNDYEFQKTLAVLFLSVLAMLLMWITIVLVAIFCVQWVQFFQSVLNEVHMLASR